MKRIQFILLPIISIVFCLTACLPDVFEGRNTYFVNNATTDTIQVVFELMPDKIFGSEKAIKSIIVLPARDTCLQSYTIGTMWTPSSVFKSIVFLSTAKDTLYKMDIINDDEWVLTDSAPDYGSPVSFYNWTYSFGVNSK